MPTTNRTWEMFRRDATQFSEKLFAELKRLGLPAHSLKPDHICFRVGSLAEYDGYKALLAGHGRCLSEARVNGRPIATFRVDEGFTTPWGKIFLIEVPSPKANKTYATDFEHCEFVIDCDFENFRRRYPQLNFQISPKAFINSEMQLKTPVGQAKFHHLGLDRVIEIEACKIAHVVFDLEGTLVDFRRESIEVFPGILEILEHLAQAGVLAHVWTSCDVSSARQVLETLGLRHYFASVSGALGSSGKPDPESLVWDWPAAPKDSVVLLGDSAVDMCAARNIGAIAAAALWNHRHQGALVSAAEITFESAEDFWRWLQKQIPTSESQTK